MSITKDATKGWARPANAAEWTELLAGTGISNPDHWWPCTEGSGNLADVIGSLTLSAKTTPNYGVAATGWAGTGVDFTDGTGDGFVAASGVGPDPATTSQVWFAMMSIEVEPTAARTFFGVTGGPTGIAISFQPSAGVNKVRITCVGVSTNGTADHSTGSYVMTLRYDRAASAANFSSDLEALVGTYSGSAVDGNKGIGIGSSTPGSITILGIGMYQGANAETLTDANLTTIRSRIESPPSGASVVYADAVYPTNVERNFGPERSARRESYFGQPTPFPPLPSYADAVYAVPPMRRRSAPGFSATLPSYFGPTSPPAPQPIYADAVYPRSIRRDRSPIRPAYFGPVSPPAALPVFFDAVYPPFVRLKGAARSALRPSSFYPADRPYLPDKDGTIPQTQYKPIQRYRTRSHLRPSFFGPSLVIADTPVTPIGSAGVATLAMNVEAKSTLTMSWLTDVMKAWNGLEQRVALLRWPRLRFNFAAALSDAQHRKFLSLLAGNAAAARVFLLGLAYEDLTVVSSAGAAITVNTLARCDWAQPGRRVVVVHPGGTAADGVIKSASGVSITTTTDLSATAVPGARIMPVSSVYLDPEQRIERHLTARGNWTIVARAERPFAVPTMGVGATVNTYESLPVWDLGVPIDVQGQPLRSGTDVVDLGGRVGTFANFAEPDWGRALRVESSKLGDWQWLKAFLDAVRGRQMPFLLPTGRPDLVPTTDASGGTLTVQGPPTANAPNYVADWFPSLAHRRLKLSTASSFAYRTVSGAIDNGNGTQTLTLDSALAGALTRVEFLETVRLDSDEVSVVFEGPRFTSDLSALVVQR